MKMNKFDENSMIINIASNFCHEAAKQAAARRLLHSYLAFDRITDTAKNLARLDLEEADIEFIQREADRWGVDVLCLTPSGDQAEWDSIEGNYILKKPFREFLPGDRIKLQGGGDYMIGGGLTPARWVKAC